MAKYRLLREAVDGQMPELRHARKPSRPLMANWRWPTSPPISARCSRAPCHDEAQQREIGFPWSERMVERARRSVGATIAAARAALCGGVCRPTWPVAPTTPTHKGSGYCVFNDVAVAARLMQAEWHRHHRRLLRVLVIDLDVHQGNGTAAIFRDDPTVFTLSLHGARNFPFRKEPSDLDVDLPDGCGDRAYLEALDGSLEQGWQRHPLRSRPAWPSTWPAPTRTRATAWAGSSSAHEGLAERDRRVLARCASAAFRWRW
jgi:acetoin utilization deacetylase AcuC-like enzyme